MGDAADGVCPRGAILVNINPAYRSHELRFTLTKSRMKAIFLWHADARADYRGILRGIAGTIAGATTHYLLRFTTMARTAGRPGPDSRRYSGARCQQHSIHLRNYRFS